MYLASLVLLAAATVTLALGIQQEGSSALLVSVGCSVLAAASAAVTVARRLRRHGPVGSD